MSDVAYDAILGSLTLRQVIGSAFELNGSTVYGTKSGAPTASAFYGGPGSPQSRIRTTDLYSPLGLASFFSQGICVDGGTILQPFQRRADCASFSSGSVHQTISGTDGHIVPTRISASSEGDAEMELMTTWKSDDELTTPFSINVNQSLSAQAYIGQYALAQCVVNGVTIDMMKSVSIDPGMAVQAKRFVGNWPSKQYIRMLRPMFELTFENFDEVFSVIGSGGYAAITSATVYFRKRSGVGFASDASSVHIALSLSGGLAMIGDMSAQGHDEGQATLRLAGDAIAYSRISTISI